MADLLETRCLSSLAKVFADDPMDGPDFSSWVTIEPNGSAVSGPYGIDIVFDNAKAPISCPGISSYNGHTLYGL